MSTMTILELARPNVVAVTPDAGATRIASLMEERDVGSVIVVEDDRPVGLVTDRDLTIEVVSQGSDPGDVTAADVMTEDLFTVHEEEGIYEVLTSASKEGVRRVPVVDDDGDLAGIVTLDDFVVLLAGELDTVSTIVQAESPPY